MKPTDPEYADLAPDAPAAGPEPEASDLKARLAEAEALVEQHLGAYLRAAADLENYRKRVAREVENARQFGVERLAGGLLPVVDGLELGLANADKADAATLTDGQRATLKLLLKALEAAGIAGIDPLGQPFNPEQHEAMAMQPTAEFPANTVVTVIQKGYLLNGRLLRPARVIVARPADA